MFRERRDGSILMLYLKRNELVVLLQFLQMLDQILHLLSTELLVYHRPEIKSQTRIIFSHVHFVPLSSLKLL